MTGSFVPWPKELGGQIEQMGGRGKSGDIYFQPAGNQSTFTCICIFIFICICICICICIVVHKAPTKLILRIDVFEMIVHPADVLSNRLVEFMPLNHHLIANLRLDNNPMNLFYDRSNITIAFIVVNYDENYLIWPIVISVLVNMVLADDAGLLGSTHQPKCLACLAWHRPH